MPQLIETPLESMLVNTNKILWLPSLKTQDTVMKIHTVPKTLDTLILTSVSTTIWIMKPGWTKVKWPPICLFMVAHIQMQVMLVQLLEAHQLMELHCNMSMVGKNHLRDTEISYIWNKKNIFIKDDYELKIEMRKIRIY